MRWVRRPLNAYSPLGAQQAGSPIMKPRVTCGRYELMVDGSIVLVEAYSCATNTYL